MTDLKPGSVYQYVVAAESAMGVGTFSEPVQQRMPPAVPARIEQPKVRFVLEVFCACVCVRDLRHNGKVAIAGTIVKPGVE